MSEKHFCDNQLLLETLMAEKEYLDKGKLQYIKKYKVKEGAK